MWSVTLAANSLIWNEKLRLIAEFRWICVGIYARGPKWLPFHQTASLKP
jgi:hypothetical protein